MDIFLAYLFFSSITPFFLWKENWKKLAIFQTPLLFLMWVAFYQYLIGIEHTYLWIFLIGNIIFTHVVIATMLIKKISVSAYHQSVKISG